MIITYIDNLPEPEQLEGYAVLEEIEKNGLRNIITKKVFGQLYEMKFYRFNRIFYFLIQPKQYTRCMHVKSRRTN